mmetsp:Transcript_18002/g.50765  ORF Transcript_18002/g.50765 Transcript_18002/m.50765 type:complete len:205 (-) Transcript_18002:86-700(-)
MATRKAVRRRRMDLESFTFGKGAAGVSRPKKSQSGAQPSRTSYTSSLSSGTRASTSALWRSYTSASQPSGCCCQPQAKALGGRPRWPVPILQRTFLRSRNSGTHCMKEGKAGENGAWVSSMVRMSVLKDLSHPGPPSLRTDSTTLAWGKRRSCSSNSSHSGLSRVASYPACTTRSSISSADARPSPQAAHRALCPGSATMEAMW